MPAINAMSPPILGCTYNEATSLPPVIIERKLLGDANFTSPASLAGFTTMIGNLAGPVSNIYFLAMRLPKNEFIGTAAWLFFIINVFKLPFHIFVWETVSMETLVLNSVMIPAMVIGFLIGVRIVKMISNINYRRFILFVTALGGLILLFR